MTPADYALAAALRAVAARFADEHAEDCPEEGEAEVRISYCATHRSGRVECSECDDYADFEFSEAEPVDIAPPGDGGYKN